MKKVEKYISFVMLGVITLLSGCDKNKLQVPFTIPMDAKVKINYASAYSSNPSVQLKINGERVSSLIQYAYPFPGGGLNTQGGSQPDYLSIPAGSSTSLSISIPFKGKETDSIQLYSGTVTFPDAGYFSVHLSDTLTNTSLSLQKEDIAAPDSGYSKFRFVNLIPNEVAIDLYFNNVLMAANIPYKGASDYFKVAFPTASSWVIRKAGASSTSTALASYSNTVSNQRVMIVFARGYSGATDANRKPNVSLYYLR